MSLYAWFLSRIPGYPHFPPFICPKLFHHAIYYNWHPPSHGFRFFHISNLMESVCCCWLACNDRFRVCYYHVILYVHLHFVIYWLRCVLNAQRTSWQRVVVSGSQILLQFGENHEIVHFVHCSSTFKLGRKQLNMYVKDLLIHSHLSVVVERDVWVSVWEPRAITLQSTHVPKLYVLLEKEILVENKNSMLSLEKHPRYT